MIKIEHIAIWVHDLEKMKAFYTHWFQFHSNDKYVNSKKGFSSYFLSSGDGNSRIESMTRDNDLYSLLATDTYGWAHKALSLGSKEQVDVLTEKMVAEGILGVGEARWTGDGYYESVIEDPDGNKIELTI